MFGYRREIDGLRALAVVPVILFHAGFEAFSGGFVGVDVFFVISGYLITSIILAEKEAGTFTLLGFYERRARRILPALFLVMAACIPFAWVWLFPDDMKDFSQSLVAVSVFASNIFFWKQSGYFDIAAELKPLLHTWSLAVEEQYYLLFPLFLIVMWRLAKRWTVATLAVIAVLSFAVAQWGAYNSPSATFFFLPTRGWEIAIGALIAFYFARYPKIQLQRPVQEAGSLIGLSLILYPVFAYSKATPFPSVYALAPTLGTALIILFTTPSTLVGRLLTTKIFVGIGLISYSAYLWHQPLFAFARHGNLADHSEILFFCLVFFSIVLAYCSWKFVEMPFRTSGFMSRRRTMSLAMVFMFVFVSFGYAGKKTNGFEQLMFDYKYSENERNYVRAVITATNYDMYKEMAVSECRLWVTNSKLLDPMKIQNCQRKYGKALVILGDSHAMNLFNIISYSEKTNPFVIGISQGGCRPHSVGPDCHYNDFLKFAASNKELIDLVVFHQSGSYLIKDLVGNTDSQAAFEGEFGGFDMENVRKVKDYLNSLVAGYKLKVLWIGPFLEYRRDPKKLLFKDELNTVNPISIELFKRLDHEIKHAIDKLSLFHYRTFSSLFYEPIQSFGDNCFVFRDRDHYSKCGEKAISRRLDLPVFEEHRP